MSLIHITESAAAQIRKSAEQGEAQGLGLRLAVRLGENNAIEYGMGFDERGPDDLHFDCAGVAILISPGSRELLIGATLDYVEINPGEFRFIFINPNDPAHVKPRQDS
jgi:iron-sulfur cluster assembly protein